MDLKMLLDFFLILPINVLSFLSIWYFKESSSSLSSRSRDQHFLQTISFFVTILFSIDSHSIVSLKNSVKHGIGVDFDIFYLLMLPLSSSTHYTFIVQLKKNWKICMVSQLSYICFFDYGQTFKYDNIPGSPEDVSLIAQECLMSLMNLYH